MIEGYSPLAQAVLGTLFTWFVTAAGSAMVFVFNGYKRWFLDASLGFAAGIMTAASFWSLLLPAIEMSQQQLTVDQHKMFSLVPVLIGFLLGAGFVYLTDILLPDNVVVANVSSTFRQPAEYESFAESGEWDQEVNRNENVRKRVGLVQFETKNSSRFDLDDNYDPEHKLKTQTNFRKILLLIIAVTVHNIPEGLAVGVGFGAIGKTPSATFQSARNLAIGIGLQNFPEGLAVSLPLYASGYSYFRSFWYGQLSGMVEPIAGILGVLMVGVAQAILPYALGFAAGAMLFVVFENIIPEASSHGNSTLATWCCMAGFSVMMCLDVGLND